VKNHEAKTSRSSDHQLPYLSRFSEFWRNLRK